MTLLCVLLISLFSLLGNWQLHRAREKTTMLTEQAHQANQPPIAWSPNRVSPKQYQTISVSGQYLTQNFLLDNQYHAHQIGYQVLTPMLLDNEHILLIDRGWIAGDPSRRTLPPITQPSQTVRLSGQTYYPSDKIWVLGQIVEKKSGDLTLIEKIDSKIISQLLHKSVYPFIIRLDKKEADGYIREWAVVSMPPERHKAYALQWFAMALVILILYIVLNLKKINEKSTTT
jgi:surfeit locus 1 family protein